MQEISQLGWFAPGEALRAFDQGEDDGLSSYRASDTILPPPSSLLLPGYISLPPPTWFMLRELAKYATLDALRMAAAQGTLPPCPISSSSSSSILIILMLGEGRDMRPVQPNLVPTDEGMVIALPGDELHWSHRGLSKARHRIVMRTIPRPPALAASADRPREEEGRAPRYALQFIDERHDSAAL